MDKKRVVIQSPCLYTRDGIKDILLDTQFSEPCEVVASISNLDLCENQLLRLSVVDIIIVTLSSTIDDPISTLRLFGEFLPSVYPNARILLIDDVISTGVIARYICGYNSLWGVLDLSKALPIIKSQLVNAVETFTDVYKISKRKKPFLSQRETIVLRLLLEGKEMAGIAINLKISYRTVSCCKRSALTKLGIQTLQALIINNCNKKQIINDSEAIITKKSNIKQIPKCLSQSHLVRLYHLIKTQFIARQEF